MVTKAKPKTAGKVVPKIPADQWIPMFARNGFSESYLTDPEKVFSEALDGMNYCVLCDTVGRFNKAEHLAIHCAEIQEWKKQKPTDFSANSGSGKKVSISAPNDPFYAVPCVDCGERIPKTGNRGRPPMRCENCRENGDTTTAEKPKVEKAKPKKATPVKRPIKVVVKKPPTKAAPKAPSKPKTVALNTEKFYPKPCEVCGKGILRTGKRGRPPFAHEKCR